MRRPRCDAHRSYDRENRSPNRVTFHSQTISQIHVCHERHDGFEDDMVEASTIVVPITKGCTGMSVSMTSQRLRAGCREGLPKQRREGGDDCATRHGNRFQHRKAASQSQQAHTVLVLLQLQGKRHDWC